MSQSQTLDTAERQRLLSIAYGHLGSLVDAEDVVQEALLRFQQQDRSGIRNVEAWLTTVVSRLCIDKLRSAQRRREVYPGEWLPEPVFDAPTPEQNAITRSRLTISLLYLLRDLEPEQRVVFVLRNVFEYSYKEIADMTAKSEGACRQLMVRARAALGTDRPLPPLQPAAMSPVVNRFIEAIAQGDEKDLLQLLSKDAVLIADGGGKVPSIVKPVHGADRIVRFFMGVQRKLGMPFDARPAIVNSGPGLLTYQAGQLASVTSLSVRGGQIVTIYSVSNPDKIQFRRTSVNS